MANFEFYQSKIIEMSQRIEWLKYSVKKANPAHSEIIEWINQLFRHFESEIELIKKLIRKGNSCYLRRVKSKHIVLEQKIMALSMYIGIMARECPQERRISKLVKKISHETGFAVKDFLISLGFQPAIITERPDNPIFLLQNETIASAYTWISLYHEIGHAMVRQRRSEIINPLVRVVRDYYQAAKADLGPMDEESRKNVEIAFGDAERYWTEGINNIRLEELFCDCFAIYSCGLAYLFNWLDFGVSFLEYPKFINACDDHPPFLARFEACWHILPENLKNSEYGNKITKLREDYLKISFSSSNPCLEYSTVCPHELIRDLSEKSIKLIQEFYTSIKQWDETPPAGPSNIGLDKPLSVVLNCLVATLLIDQKNYLSFEKRVIDQFLKE